MKVILVNFVAILLFSLPLLTLAKGTSRNLNNGEKFLCPAPYNAQEFSKCCQTLDCETSEKDRQICCQNNDTVAVEEKRQVVNKVLACVEKLTIVLAAVCDSRGGVCIKDTDRIKDCCRKQCSRKELKSFCCSNKKLF